MATQRFRNWFFQVTSVLRADGTIGGIRFRKSDKPTQQTMEDFSESIAFKKESSDRAKIYTGATDLGTEQGLSVLATDSQATSNAAQLGDRSLVVQPHQLPTAENLDAAALEDMPVQTMDIAAEVGTTTRNRFQFRLNLPWLTWLVSRIFKSGGVSGDVPIKTDGTNYNWGWGNLANNSTFINSLLANNTFINSLTTTIINNNPTAITDALPVGTVLIQSAGSANPLGTKWVVCEGQVLNIVDYPDLVDYFNNYTQGGVATYGGDGIITFALPDYNNKVLRHGATANIGITGGADTHTISANNLPSLPVTGYTDPSNTGSGSTNNDGNHAHPVAVDAVIGVGTDPGLVSNPLGISTTPGIGIAVTSSSEHTHNITSLPIPSINITGTANNGSPNTALDTRDPYIKQAYYIKVLK